MILESFARLSRKEKYRIDIVGQSGEEAVIPLVPLDTMPQHAGDRYKVIQKMGKSFPLHVLSWPLMIRVQLSFLSIPGLATTRSKPSPPGSLPSPRATQVGPPSSLSRTLADFLADDFFVVVVTDANFERYGITGDDLKRVMDGNSKVKVSLIAIGEGAEATWLPKALPGRAYRVKETTDIATTLRAILGQMLTGGL